MTSEHVRGPCPETARTLDTSTRRKPSPTGCAASRARCAGCSGWSTRTRYCIDVLTQISAVTRALQGVALAAARRAPRPLRRATPSTPAVPTPTPRSPRRRPRSPVSSRVVSRPCRHSTTSARACARAFFMFWETLWPLILGFGLSGAVQAFVSQRRDAAGHGRPPARGRGTRQRPRAWCRRRCSYAATAMAKSLFQKGADFVDRDDLHVRVDEPRARARHRAPRADGLAVRGGRVRRRTDHDRAPRAHRRARRHARAGRARPEATAVGRWATATTTHAMVGVSDERQAELEREPWRAKLRSRAAWADAASYTMADLTMLRRELVIGYVVAGFLTVLVPTQRLERRVPARATAGLDVDRERDRRAVHRDHQLRLLDRQRADGGRAVAGRHQLRRRDQRSSSPTSSRSRCCSSTASTTARGSRCGCSSGSGR